MILTCCILFFVGILIGTFSIHLVSKKTSFLYLLISGFSSVLIFVKYKYFLNTIMYLIVLYVMLFVGIYDTKTYTIPNIYIVIGLINRIVFSLIQNNNLIGCLINGITISLPILLLSIVMSLIYKKETMGGGDIKLLFMLGTYFDLYHNVLSLMSASILALIYILIFNKKNNRIAFGPFINIAYYLLIII